MLRARCPAEPTPALAKGIRPVFGRAFQGLCGRLPAVVCSAGSRKGGSRTRTPPVPPPGSPAAAKPARFTPDLSDGSEGDEDDIELPYYVRPEVRMQVENLPLKSIIADIKSGEINLQPRYQRSFVWSKENCTRFVRTVYKNVASLPVTFHRKEKPGENVMRDVVDGQQRLATLYTFITGDTQRFPEVPTRLELPDDDMSRYLDGKTFQDLHKHDKSQMENYMITVHTIPPNAELDYVYEVYVCMNSGGVGHTAQQLRKAVYNGPYIDMLARLSKHDTFKQLAELTQEEEKEDEGDELVLRFFALYRAAVPAFKRPLKANKPMEKFLREELQTVDPATGRSVKLILNETEVRDMEAIFKTSMDVCADLGLKELAEEALKASSKGKAFRKGSTGHPTPLWDTTLLGLRLALEDGVKPGEFKRRKANVRSGFLAMLRDPLWAEAVKGRLTSTSLSKRLGVFRQCVIGAEQLTKPPAASPQGARAFSSDVRDRLFEQEAARNPCPGGGVRCAWCGRPIVEAKDAQVDHVLPYARGGTTTLDNAQLLHAICNQERGTKPMSAAPAAGAGGARSG